ncbi:unnamed protein product [Cochlearia groenlandica]
MNQMRRLINDGRCFTWGFATRGWHVMQNPDTRPTFIKQRVEYLLTRGSGSVNILYTAADYARLSAFTRFQESDQETETETCESIIKAMFLANGQDEANLLYHFFFVRNELRPNTRICNYIIESRFKIGFVYEALDFHRYITSLGFIPLDDDTYHILTKGLVDYGLLDLAKGLLSQLGSSSPLPFNNLIRGFLNDGDFDKANQVLEDFKNRGGGGGGGVALFMATFMEYWFKQGNEIEAMECYQQQRQLHCNIETCNVVLEILLKYDKKELAWTLFDDMLWLNGDFDTRTVEIMVDECFNMGRYDKAMEIYNKAKKEKGNSGCCYMIAKCCGYGMLAEAESLFFDDDSLVDGFGVKTWKTMIDAYVKAGRMEDAIKTSNKMIHATLKDVTRLF